MMTNFTDAELSELSLGFWGEDYAEAPVRQLARALIAERAAKDAEIEKLRTAICWIEPPFIDENTSEAELRKRISFCVQDANRALRAPLNDV
jgi:hypothetical protein